MEPASELIQEIAGQVTTCTRCQLSLSRKKAVPGEGPGNAEIMLIGEGPGFYENEQGRPFVGAAGKFLSELLQKAGVSRPEVFITNVVKCRPPSNRDPLPEELSACNDYLERQIEAINPFIIVTLGRFSMAKFLPNVKISEVHGKPAWVRGRLVIPMFHPAAALHQPSLKTSVERDFARLPEWIQQAHQSRRQAAENRNDAQEEGLPIAAATLVARQEDLFSQAALVEPLQPPEPAEPPSDESGQMTQLSLF
jgi:uracil-DNA glycosylase